ncbi:MAG: hypothetical protein HUJ75_07650, partial [Parasporobacterium sp.]|nr:hypothetical protein [Parasporobacterium sp.]
MASFFKDLFKPKPKLLPYVIAVTNPWNKRYIEEKYERLGIEYIKEWDDQKQATVYYMDSAQNVPKESLSILFGEIGREGGGFSKFMDGNVAIITDVPEEDEPDTPDENQGDDDDDDDGGFWGGPSDRDDD